MSLVAQRALFLAWYIGYRNHYTKRPMQKGIPMWEEFSKMRGNETFVNPIETDKGSIEAGAEGSKPLDGITSSALEKESEDSQDGEEDLEDECIAL